jgi:hypothetical protein
MAKNITASADEICTDPEIAHLKQTMLKRLRRNSLLSSIGDTCKFIAGPMFGIGIGAAISIGTVAATLPLALLGAAMAFLVIGVTSSYSASRIWQAGQFDNYEITAQSTARHIVQEIKKENSCIAEQPARTDGKSWTEVVKARSNQPTQSL